MGRRKDPIHGFIYQLKLLMLFLHRGICRKYDFILRTEMEEAGSFDDLFFEYKENNKKFFRLLQAKHSLDESKKISTSDLLAGMNKDQKYSLIKYYYSFMKCRNQKLFKSGSFKDFIICTNIDFDMDDLESKGIEVYPVTGDDDFLNINLREGRKKPMRYRFSENFAGLLQKELENNYDSSIVKSLVDFILGNKALHKNHFGNYVNALASEVIDKKNKKIAENFVSNENLSPRASEFRQIFEHELKKQSKNKLNLVTLNEAIVKEIPVNGKIIRLNIPQAFGQNPGRKESIWPSKNIDINDVSNFLKLLIFAVNQINEDELGEAIKDEMGDQFNKITSETIYRNLFQHMVDFLQDKLQKGKTKMKFWSFEEGKTFIRNTCFEIIRLQLAGYRNLLDSVNCHFKETSFDRPQIFINSEKPLWILTSKTPWLSTLAIYQSIKNNSNSLELFIYKWNDLLDNNGQILFDFEGLDEFLIVVTCLQTIGTEDVTANFVEKIEKLFFNDINKHRKIIVIASKNHEFRRQLLLRYQMCHCEELNIGFSDLEETSQRSLMEKPSIYFQGSCLLSLQNILNIKKEDMQAKTEMLNLDASAMELLLRNPEIKIFNHTSDYTSITYKPNKPLTFSNVMKEVKSNENDIFTFYGDDDNIKMLFRSQQINLVTFRDTNLLSELIKNRFILLESEIEKVEFDCLCKFLYECKHVISENYKPSVHKLKYVDKDKWIWMQTFDSSFYITREYKPNTVSKRILSVLAEKDSQDYILFSGLLQNKVYNEIFNYCKRNNIEFNRYTLVNNCCIVRLKKTAKRKFNFLCKFVNENEVYIPNDSYTIATHLRNKQAIHWIKFHDMLDYENKQKLRLEWQQSAGNISTIRNRRNAISLHDENFLSEENLIFLNERLMLLADGTGSGKSCNLTQVAQNLKKIKPTSLVIEIDLYKLQQHSVSFCIESKIQLINFLFRVLKKSKAHVIEKKIIQYKMDHSEQIVLLFDSFDEIKKMHQESVLNLLKFILHNTKINIWITIRPENKDKLEKSMCALSYSFNPLKKSDKIKYLCDFWRVCTKFCDNDFDKFNFRRYASIVNQHFASITKTFNFSCFIEIPLMLRSVAITYLHVLTDPLINDSENGFAIESKIQKVNFTDIFESFVRYVYDIYFFNKMKMFEWFDKESQAILRDAYSNAYRCLAIKRVCQNVYTPSISLGYMKEKISLSTLSRIGLIQIYDSDETDLHKEINSINQDINSNMKYDFIHPSFAECFVAEFICVELKNNPTSKNLWEFLIDTILLLPFSRKVFDDKLETDVKLSSLSSQNEQKKIIFNIFDMQVQQHGTARTLWKVAGSRLRRTVVFLMKWFQYSNYHNMFNYYYCTAVKRILNLHIDAAVFSHENELIDYIMNHQNTSLIHFSAPNNNITFSEPSIFFDPYEHPGFMYEPPILLNIQEIHQIILDFPTFADRRFNRAI